MSSNLDSATTIITFSGLVPGGSTTAYTERGYTLYGDNIYTGVHNGIKGAFPSDSTSVFTLRKADGADFTLVSAMLMTINDEVGPQTIIFTGNLADGGTATYGVTTPATLREYSTYAFPGNFAKVASVVWTPRFMVMTNIYVVSSAR